MTRRRATTMEDVARLARVSKPTVSRALRGSPLVTEETRRHVLAVAEKYGYVVNRNAQKLRRKRADTVAVVLDFRSHRENRISDPFIFDLLAGVSEALAQRNQDLLLCSPGHSSGTSLSAIISSKGADGIIFLGQGERGPELIALARSAVPFVVWGAVEPDLPYCAIGSDNFRGGQLVGAHLLARGRRRIFFVGNTNHGEIRLRREGLAASCAAAEVEIRDIVINDFSYGASYRTAEAMLRDRSAVPDAIFACSDTAAMAFINAFRAAGHAVPEAVSVVGYNDIPAAVHFHPPLTTVHQDVHAAGTLLVEKLMMTIEGHRPGSVMLETRLVVRGSS
ncbi:MAG: LacI family DNA-binding transcriptional regulator [Rhodothalassiaceae bacterium]